MWRVKDTIANNTSLGPSTTMNILRSFSRQLLSEHKLFTRLCTLHKPCQHFVLVSAVRCATWLQSRFNIYIHLLISEESDLAADAKHHSSVTKYHLRQKI